MSRAVLHVWRIPLHLVPLAVLRMGWDRLLLRTRPNRTGPTFHKLLGTGDGRTFDVRDADLRHWALLTVWDTPEDALAFEAHPTVRGWRRIAIAEWRADLSCLQSRGEWGGRQPFTPSADPAWTGPVASITRARIKPAMWTTFWRAVPDVVADLDHGHGPLTRIGIGEAPIGLQGTFTVWPDADALRDFAHRRSPHRAAIADTKRLDWYAEELFARFAVVAERGELFGQRSPLTLPPSPGAPARA